MFIGPFGGVLNPWTQRKGAWFPIGPHRGRQAFFRTAVAVPTPEMGVATPPTLLLAPGSTMDEVGSHALLVNLCLAVAAGTFLVVLARRLKLPTIVLLLLGGISLGPQGFGLIHPDALGDALRPIVSLSVALILFEGGLTLDLHGFTQASRVIQRLLTLGVVVTWLGTAGAIWLIFGYDLLFCVFVASLVIVTGPTVILPLLRRIHVQPRLNGILHWEGVLIDAIGVFIAILSFEWIVAGEGGAAAWHFVVRVLAGTVLGVGGGFFIDVAIRRHIVPEALVNSFALAAAVLGFGLTEWIMPEAGLLAVTLAGLVVGWRHPVELKQIQQFKAEITDLLIGTLFIVLAGRLELARFVTFGKPMAWLLAAIIFVVRPLNVLVSTVGSTLPWRERAFLAWIAPRGIVAASMASLFALDLVQQGSTFDASFIEPFVYSVIGATVILQGFSAGIVARLLRVRQPEPTGWLIVGAHQLGARLARFITRATGHDVLVLDSNPRLVAEAAALDVRAQRADALDVVGMQRDDRFQNLGHIVALTDNSELNELVCHRWHEVLDRATLQRWGGGRIANPATSSRRAHLRRAGSVVWERLPRPGLLSAELQRGEAVISEVVLGEEPRPPEGMIIAVARKDGVTLDPAAAGDFAGREGDHLLVLRRSGGFLARGLDNGAIEDIAVTSADDLFAQLAGIVTRCRPDVTADALLADIMERERLMPTWLGHGLGVPHAFVRGLTDRIVVLGRLQPPLRVDGQPEPVSLVFLVVSPSGDAEGHLATLADIAHLAADPENRARILSANDRDAVVGMARALAE